MSFLLNETRILRSGSCDMNGEWLPNRILEAMQETADSHSSILGLDGEVMNGLGLVWVLARLKVEFIRPARMNETIHIETWPTPNRHLFYPRSHVFRDESGAIIGRANSLWVTIDLTSRRITKNEFVESKLPKTCENPMVLAMPATVRTPDSEAKIGIVTPSFTDLDVNMHVNNTKYLDWCLNALGTEILKDRCLLSFDINYDLEILPGTKIRTELTLDGDKFVFCGFDGAKKHFSIGGVLSPRA